LIAVAWLSIRELDAGMKNPHRFEGFPLGMDHVEHGSCGTRGVPVEREGEIAERSAAHVVIVQIDI
jgi:hypothetical protein